MPTIIKDLSTGANELKIGIISQKMGAFQIIAPANPPLSTISLLQLAAAPPVEGINSLLLQELRIQYTATIWNAPPKMGV